MNPHRGKGRASSGSHTGPGSDYEGSSGSAASWQARFRGRGGREGDGRGGIGNRGEGRRGGGGGGGGGGAERWAAVKSCESVRYPPRPSQVPFSPPLPTASLVPASAPGRGDWGSGVRGGLPATESESHQGGRGGRGRGRGHSRGNDELEAAHGRGGGGRWRQRGRSWGGGEGGYRARDEISGCGRQSGASPEELQRRLASLDIGSSESPTQIAKQRTEIAQVERQREAGRIAVSSSKSSSALVAPHRPTPGIEGKAIRLLANHFRVNLNLKLGNIFQYDVEISPRVSSVVVSRALERELVASHSCDLGGKYPVYDGRKNMYTCGPLPFEQRDFAVTLPEDGCPTVKIFIISIKRVAVFDSRGFIEFLRGREIQLPQLFLQALDVVLRENPSHHFIPVSRSFYREDLGKRALEGGLVGWNGFYQSLRPTMQGLVLNVDLSTTAFHESIPVLEFLRRKFKSFDPQHGLGDSDHSKVKRVLVKLRIQVTHRSTPRRYRIAGLSSRPTWDLKFPLESGEEIRVVDYFRTTYNYNIRYPELPCLQVQGRKVSYLPMEVCRICEGQKFGGRLTDAQTKNLLRLACLKPYEREKTIRRIMCREDGPGRGRFLGEFGLDVTAEMTSVRARLLPAPKLRYGEAGSVQEIVPQCGSWNLMNACVVEGGQVRYWAVIIFDSRVRSNEANMFIHNLSNRCAELGVEMVPKTVVPPSIHRREDLESPRLDMLLRTVHKQALQVIVAADPGAHLQLLVCIMAEKHSQYGELKRICETEIGLVTQCCLSKHTQSCSSQYLAHLALKINAKVGGRNVTLALELPGMCPAVFNKPTMIFGADVTHPRPTDNTSPSIAAVVANTDWPSANRYVARVRAQKPRLEIIEHLNAMVRELWKEFCMKVGSRPETILFFRDGVSEGQFDSVLQDEVVALKEALMEEGGPDYKPLITWAVVQKRHHTRLFPTDANKDKSHNILPGTVVDTTITHPREFDFYLCSHAGIQGTSRPTHYHILWDENNFCSDDLQGLVYHLCYTYVRCTRAVSVVPPAYYAHLAAYRSRLYLDAAGGGSDTTSLKGGRPGGTQGSGGRASTKAAPAVIPSLPQIQPVVQQVMYYC